MEPVKATTLSLNVLAVAFISFCTCAPMDTIFGENGLVFTNNTEHQQKQPINPGKFAVSISGKVTPRIFGPVSDSDDPDFSDFGQAKQPHTKTQQRGGGRQQAGSGNKFLAGPKHATVKWRPPPDKPTTPRSKAPSTNRQPLLPLVLQKTLESLGEYKNSKNVKVSAIIIIEDESSDGSTSTIKPRGTSGSSNNQGRRSFNEEPEDELQPQEQNSGAMDMTNDGED